MAWGPRAVVVGSLTLLQYQMQHISTGMMSTAGTSTGKKRGLSGLRPGGATVGTEVSFCVTVVGTGVAFCVTVVGTEVSFCVTTVGTGASGVTVVVTVVFFCVTVVSTVAFCVAVVGIEVSFGTVVASGYRKHTW